MDSALHAPTHVTDEEAREILSRFIASHFRETDREIARFSIPPRFDYDDDLRMALYIADNANLRAAAREALDVLTRLADSAHRWAGSDVPVGLVAEVDSAKARLAGALSREARP